MGLPALPNSCRFMRITFPANQKYFDLNPLFIMPFGLTGGFGSPKFAVDANTAYADLSDGNGFTADNSPFAKAGTFQPPVCTVSGGQGATTLTATYSAAFADAQDALSVVASNQSAYGIVLRYASGRYGVHTVTANSSTTLTIRPPLPEPVYNAPVWECWEGDFSQHESRHHAKARAWFFHQYSPIYARRQGIINRFDRLDDSTVNAANAAPWTGYGITLSGVNTWWAGALNSFPNSTSYGNQLHSVGTKALHVTLASSGTGIQKTVSVAGIAGWVETTIGVQTGAAPVKVELIGDAGLSSQRIIQNWPSVYGLDQIRGVFGPGYSTMTLRISSTTASQVQFRIGSTTFFRGYATDSRIFAPGSKGALISHSWGDRHGGAFCRALNELLEPEGSSVVSFSKAAKTSDYMLANIASFLGGKGFDWALIQADINDANAADDGLGFGAMTQARSNANHLAMANYCKSIGVKPIISMPWPCQRIESAQTLFEWLANFDGYIANNQALWYP